MYRPDKIGIRGSKRRERKWGLSTWITLHPIFNPFTVWFQFKTGTTIMNHHDHLAAGLLARICCARKIIDRIKIHGVQLKGRKIEQHPGSPHACEANSSEIPVCVPLVQELSHLTEQIEIRTSYLCLTALYIPEGDAPFSMQQPWSQSNKSTTIYSSIHNYHNH